MNELEGNIQLLTDGLPLQSVSYKTQQNNNTLDEPIKETILRDLNMIWFKLKYVMNP